MNCIQRWRIRCTTDSVYEYIWSSTKPTVCPTDAGHSVDATSVVVVGSRECLAVVVDPSMSAVEPGSSVVVANGRPAVEIQNGQDGWGAILAQWPHDVLSVAKLDVTLKFILKAAGTGSIVRVGARAKSESAGDDSSAAWADTQYLDVAVTHTTVGETFEGKVTLDASNFSVGDALALQIGREGSHANDDVDVAMQITGVKAVAR